MPDIIESRKSHYKFYLMKTTSPISLFIFGPLAEY